MYCWPYGQTTDLSIRSEFPRKQFLRQGHKERYTADDQDGDKGNLPSDSRRVQKIWKKQMKKNAYDCQSRNVVRLYPHSKCPGSSEKTAGNLLPSSLPDKWW